MRVKIIDLTKLKRIVRKYYEQFYVNRKSRKSEKFPRNTNNLTQKIQKNLDISMTAKVIESLTKTSHQIKVHGQMVSLVNPTKHKLKLTKIVIKLF